MSKNNSKVDRKRIGLLVPSSNTILENDIHKNLSEKYFTVHTSRMRLRENTPEDEKRMIEEFSIPAAEQLKPVHPELLVFGCTSAGSLFGPEYDKKITRELGNAAGCKCVGVLSCVIESLKRRGAKRVAVITPYIDDLNNTIQMSLEESGFEVACIHGMGITLNFETSQVEPEEIVSFAKEKLIGVKADAVFVSCANYRALEAQKELESVISLPVVTSNMAVLESIKEHFETTQISTT